MSLSDEPSIGAARELRRREQLQRRRAQVRRRRIVAGGLLVLVIAAIVATVASAVSGGAGSASRAAAPRHAARHLAAARGARPRPSPPPARGTGPPGTASVPILMYHVINPPPHSVPYPGLYVPAPEFAAQMHALKDAGWHAVTMDELQAYWTRGVPLGPGKPIVLSFDNGYASQYTNALPVLRSLGWVGVENIQLTGLPESQGGLTDAQVRGLIRAGWELDTQGISHADLIALDAAQLHYQVTTARQILQRRYHQPVNWFCYPSGHYNATVIAEVKRAGFIGSTTVIPGWAGPSDDRYRLPRLRVLGGTSPSALLAQIAAAQHSSLPPTSYGGA
jgi:peptidoglycan/xylan/chitin deacetylase (PgdA/CDA1 family)